MSTQEFAHLLAQYVLQRQLRSDQDDTDTGLGSFSVTVWQDIERIFKVLSSNLMKPNDYNTAICQQAFPASITHYQAKRAVCRQMVNIFLFMDGIHRENMQWNVRSTQGHNGTFEKYVRCIMGNVALIELFWNNCEKKEMLETVSMYMHAWRQATEYNDNSGWCNALDYNTLVVGTKYVGLTMAEWIRSWKHENQKGRVGTHRSVGACAGLKAGGTTSNNASSEPKTPIVRIFHEGEADNVHKAVEQGQTFTPNERHTLLARLKKEGARADGFKSVVENVGHTASAKPAPAKPAPQTPVAPGAAATPPGAPPAGTKPQAPPVKQPQAPTHAVTETNDKQEDGSKDDKNKNQVPPSGPPATTIPEGKSATSAGASVGSNDPTTSETTPVTTTVTPTPAPPAAPAAGSTGQGPGQGPGPGQQPPPPPPSVPSGTEDTGTKSPPPAAPQPPKKDETTPVTAPEATSPGKATCLGSSGTSPGVSISCGSTSDSDLGLTDDVRKLLEAQHTSEHAPTSPNPSSETGTEGVDRTTSRSPGAPAGGNTGDQKDPLKPEETAKEKSTIAAARDTSQHTPKDPQKPHDHVDNPPTTNTLDGSSKDQSDKSNTRPKEQPTIKDPVFDAEFWDFVTGVSPKNDKTKNKDEFGPLDANIPGLTGTACSGYEKLCSLNTAYRGPGASGPASPPSTTNHEGTGSNKTNGGNDFGLGTDPPKPEGELGGNYGPRPAQVPHPIGPNKGPSNDGGPTPPDLTDTVLTATTPLLFFLTSVIVALLGYSLWKRET
ncbi:hypothetical protein AK88_04614 [Plasmodium fragile]|uniref:Schizont-infected cell agglutination extracellular alpha domain-containing protein n=1 Tax=Plasmodium fragile TaxID=5857 RepID=A0A0D9QFH1_PLAFR|nr:uncharacterized protein AK88_04614 [Plasmodium fragile]KJP85744.1 hypothetical protein AK88_04614 [Plasmodium fragile]